MAIFSDKQLSALRRNLDSRAVRTRQRHGRELHYIEGWYAISEANRIFGFDRWDRETVETRCVFSRENRGNFQAVYTAKVRITVRGQDADLAREGHGTGEAHGASPGEVHDVALKAAETDATKRALATFGKRFGLTLYNRAAIWGKPQKANDHSRLVEAEDKDNGKSKASTPNGGYASDQMEVAEKIDKSILSIATPKRLRNRAHLQFVAEQPCLICGRVPSDAHHLKFSQPRALGLNVSDEFTVPLCRGHHRELHNAGNEQQWWTAHEIDALTVANGMWQRSRSLELNTLHFEEYEEK
jgi:hypothetical protein